MSDIESDSPMGTSEATPPHVDDSPEMVNQPSPPEVTSSTDRQSPVIVDPPDQEMVSSSLDQEATGNAGPSRQLTEAERLLLESNEARAIESGSLPNIPSQPSSNTTPGTANRRNTGFPADSTLRLLLEAPTLLLQMEANSRQRTKTVPLTTMSLERYQTAQLRAAIASPEIQKILREAFGQGGTSQDFNEKTKMQNTKNPSVLMDLLKGETLPTGSGSQDALRVENKASEETGVGSVSIPKIVYSAAEETGSLLSPTEMVGLETNGNDIPVLGRGATVNVGLGSELRVPGLEGTSINSSKSPKRKSPSKEQHVSPKRSSPFPSPDKTGDSNMSALLKELEIKETDDKTKSSEPISGSEQDECMVVAEPGEPESEETQQDRNMDVNEPESEETQQDKHGCE